MRLVFAGTPTPAVAALKELVASDHEVVVVLTQPPARRGRGRKLRSSPVAEFANSHGIEVLSPATLRTGTDDGDTVRRRLAELAPDCLPVVAYGQLIPADLLDVAEHGWVNLHFSLLPRWRGAAPVQAAIRAGDTETGVCVFRIEEGLDTGPVLGRAVYDLAPGDTADRVLEVLSARGASLLVETLTALAVGEVVPEPQPEEGTYAPKIATADAHIPLGSSAEECDRTVRAYTSVPGAWVSVEGESTRIKIGAVRVASEAGALEPGRLRFDAGRVFVGTATTPLEVLRLQPPGKTMMDAAAWARGVRDGEGTVWA